MNIKLLITMVCGVLVGCNSGGGDSAPDSTNNILPKNEFETYLSNSYQIEPTAIRKLCDNDSVACEMNNADPVVTINYDLLTAIARPCFLQQESHLKKLVWNISKSYMSLDLAMGFNADEGCIVESYSRNYDQAYISFNGREQHLDSVYSVSVSDLINGSNTEYTLYSTVTIDSSFITKESFQQLISGGENFHEDYSQSLGFDVFVDSYVISLVNASNHYDSEQVNIDIGFSNYFWFPEHSPIIELIEKTWQ